MNKRRSIGVVLLATGLIVACTGCYEGNPGGPRVGDVGDSITTLATGDIQSDLSPSYAWQVDGKNGFTMAEQLPALEAIDNDPQGAPADWIVELGTNDADFHQNPNWQTDYDNEINAVSEASCVILVTVSPVLGFNGPLAPDLNNAMRETAASDPTKYHVLDWGNIEYENPAWVSNQDDIHETPAGAQELASLELSSLQTDCGS